MNSVIAAQNPPTAIDLDEFALRVESHCVRPASDTATTPDRIIVVPTGSPIAEGFARARRALAAGETVRILGCGVIYPDSWPAWVTEARNLSLVELGVYHLRTRMEASRSLAQSLRSWCDQIFDELVRGLRGAEVFFGGAAGRLLQELMDCTAFVEGVRALHSGKIVEVVGPDWLRNWLTGQQEPFGHAFVGRLVLPGLVTLGLLASSLRAIDDYECGAPSRERMRASKAVAPTLWLAMIPDRPRANKHLADTLGREALARGEPIGVLLIQSWGVGKRKEAAEAVPEDTVLSALGPLASHFPGSVTLAQAVMPERRAALFRALSRGALASLRATARVMRFGGPPNAPFRPVALAKLLSHDVLVATLAAEAASRLGATFPPGSRIIFCAANLPVQAAPERVLSHLGVRTAEYMHGLGSDSWHGNAESQAATRIVWTKTDLQGQRPTGQRMIVAGLPTSPPRRVTPGFRNILILTNYFHRNILVTHGGTKRAPYQRELLAIPEELRRELAEWPLDFRWRPHPAELSDLIARAYANLADVELSQGHELEDDLEWADLVVSAHSSAAVQAMFVGMPVFVHLRPEMVDSPFTAYVPEERRFQTSHEAVTRIIPCLHALARGDANILEPESRARMALVGSAAPKSLLEAVYE